jgi:hypothetical protein
MTTKPCILALAALASVIVSPAWAQDLVMEVAYDKTLSVDDVLLSEAPVPVALFRAGADPQAVGKSGSDWDNFFKNGSDWDNFFKNGSDWDNFFKNGSDWDGFFDNSPAPHGGGVIFCSGKGGLGLVCGAEHASRNLTVPELTIPDVEQLGRNLTVPELTVPALVDELILELLGVPADLVDDVTDEALFDDGDYLFE